MKLIETGTMLYRKYKEPFWYLIVGGLTTVIDLAVYYVLDVLTPLHYSVRYFIAWAAAVVFAFFPNRILVFGQKDGGNIPKQFAEFVSSRVATFVIGEVLLWLLVSVCSFPDPIMKPIVQVLIVVLNYVFSKLFVFKK